MDPNGLNSTENQNSIQSPIEVTPFVKSKIEEWSIKEIKTTEDLFNLGEKLHNYLNVLPYNDETKKDEEKIRWKRTGSQILQDRYVYEGKACTDMVVALITLTRAAGIDDTRFVKLINKERDMVHSVGEFKIGGIWYTYDIANKGTRPIVGEIIEANPFRNYVLW